MVIGIDVGTSTTKIVGLRDNEVISPIRIRATDPVTSLYGAFGKFLHDNGISLNEIKQVMLTGVGSAYVNEPIYGLSTSKAEEFMADGLGAQFESKQDRMLVVSMGTGTSIVKVEGNDIKHIGGMGIGGGTLKGLAQLLLNTDDMKLVAQMAEVIQECPQLKVAIGHFGMPTTASFRSQVLLAREGDNVMVESGGITWLYNPEFYPFPTAVRRIREAADLVGWDRLMWGSDYPRTITAITYRMSYDFVEKSTDLTDDEKRLFLGENAQRFYGFENLPELPYIKNMSE